MGVIQAVAVIGPGLDDGTARVGGSLRVTKTLPRLPILFACRGLRPSAFRRARHPGALGYVRRGRGRRLDPPEWKVSLRAGADFILERIDSDITAAGYVHHRAALWHPGLRGTLQVVWPVGPIEIRPEPRRGA